MSCLERERDVKKCSCLECLGPYGECITTVAFVAVIGMLGWGIAVRDWCKPGSESPGFNGASLIIVVVYNVVLLSKQRPAKITSDVQSFVLGITPVLSLPFLFFAVNASLIILYIGCGLSGLIDAGFRLYGVVTEVPEEEQETQEVTDDVKEATEKVDEAKDTAKKQVKVNTKKIVFTRRAISAVAVLVGAIIICICAISVNAARTSTECESDYAAGEPRSGLVFDAIGDLSFLLLGAIPVMWDNMTKELIKTEGKLDKDKIAAENKMLWEMTDTCSMVMYLIIAIGAIVCAALGFQFYKVFSILAVAIALCAPMLMAGYLPNEFEEPEDKKPKSTKDKIVSEAKAVRDELVSEAKAASEDQQTELTEAGAAKLVEMAGESQV